MKIYISYFNNIRHFNKYDIPLSTAMWDPKWFTHHIDKNGVINGLKCTPLIMDWEKWSQLCIDGEECRKDCQFKHGSCKFEQVYYEHLKTVKIKALLGWFQAICYKVAELNNDDIEKFRIVLIVHEPPTRDCAERPVIMKWFKENNIDIEEWRQDL